MTDIYDQLMATGQWGDREIKLGIEFDFKCAYCDKDMFESVDSYKEWQTDHLVPFSKSNDDTYENCVLSCRTCNFIKGTWNPEQNQAEPLSRIELIGRARKYVFEKRSLTQSQINEYKRITRQLS
ncbi:HNH endonuclease [Vibrio fluvialis]